MTKKATQRTTGAGTGRGRSAKRKGMGAGRPAGVAVSGPSAATATLAAPTREQIALRARVIWEQRGCPQGQDEQIWLEAERQLKEEAERS
jgi:hypothetical protein